MTISQKCEAVPMRARIEVLGAWTCVSLNLRLESNKKQEEEEIPKSLSRADGWGDGAVHRRSGLNSQPQILNAKP